MQGILPGQKTQAPAQGGDAEEAGRQERNPQPRPQCGGRGPQSEQRWGPYPAQSTPTFRDEHPYSKLGFALREAGESQEGSPTHLWFEGLPLG